MVSANRNHIAPVIFKYGRFYQKKVMKDNVKLEGDKREKKRIFFYFKKNILSLGYQFIFDINSAVYIIYKMGRRTNRQPIEEKSCMVST